MKFLKILKGLLLIVFAPIEVLFNERIDKILHFYVWAVANVLNLWLFPFAQWKGLITMLLIIFAIGKEYVIDKKPDYGDLKYSTLGCWWTTILYLIVSQL